MSLPTKLTHDGAATVSPLIKWISLQHSSPSIGSKVLVIDKNQGIAYRTRKLGEWENKRYDVMVDWTPCNYGGKRPWWLCPCCGRRVAVLWGGGTYACRHCQQINYESTRNTPESQAFARAGKVRKQLGWCAGIANPPGGRPKGMHQQTYERLLHHYYELANQAFGASSEAMDKVMGRLRGIPFKPI